MSDANEPKWVVIPPDPVDPNEAAAKIRRAVWRFPILVVLLFAWAAAFFPLVLGFNAPWVWAGRKLDDFISDQ